MDALFHRAPAVLDIRDRMAKEGLKTVIADCRGLSSTAPIQDSRE